MRVTSVLPAMGLPHYRADIAVDYEDAAGKAGARSADVGDLAELEARDTIDACGLFIHPGSPAANGAGRPEVGGPAWLIVGRRADAASEPVRAIGGPPATPRAEPESAFPGTGGG